MKIYTLFLVIFIPVCLFNAFLVRSTKGNILSLQRDKDGMFNHLTRAFLAGQTDLLIKPRPELLAMKDPYDVAMARPYQLHDASLYKGKYYVYFGPTPVVTLFLPFRLVTGIDLSEGMAALIFALAGYCISCLLFVALAHSTSAALPGWMSLGGFLALGLCTFVPYALKSSNVYEVAQMSGYCYFMAGSYLFYRAVQARVRRRVVFALAGFCFGLCVGCRPNYVAGVILVLGLCAAIASGLTKRASISRADFRGFAAPILLCGLGLAAYNYVRFGSPLEFGFKYQLTDVQGMNNFHFRLANIPYGVLYELLSPPDISKTFSFVHAAVLRPGSDYVPPGMQIYPVVGLLPAMPLVLLALLPFPGLLAWRRLPAEDTGAGRLTVAVLLLIAVANFLVISALGSYTVRYGLDFAPALVLVALVSLALVFRTRFRYRKLAAIAACLVIAGCACEGGLLAISGDIDGAFFAHPRLYRQVAAAFNRVTGGQTPAASADVRLEALVRFPQSPSGLMQPILTTGHAGTATFVGVRYPHPGEAQFYYQHLQFMADFGPILPVLAGKPYDLNVHMDPETSSVTVRLDDAIAYQQRVPLYPVQLNEIAVGRNPVWSPGRASLFQGDLEVRGFSATASDLWRANEPQVPSVTPPR